MSFVPLSLRLIHGTLLAYLINTPDIPRLGFPKAEINMLADDLLIATPNASQAMPPIQTALASFSKVSGYKLNKENSVF